MRKVRNEHGTRVLRPIVCTSCGKRDTIDFAPKDPETVLCKACAFEKLGVYDPDDADTMAKVRPQRKWTDDDGFEIQTNNTDRVKQAKRLKSGVVRIRRRD